MSSPRSNCSIKVRSDLVAMSSFLLASAIVRPCWVTSWMASLLNSAVNIRRGMLIVAALTGTSIPRNISRPGNRISNVTV